MGGSKIAVGSTHIVVKSLVRPTLEVHAIRGVDAVEIIPQHIRRRNLAMSSRRQSVLAAAIATTPRVPTAVAATYQRNSGGRRHHAHSVTTARRLRRLVSDVAVKVRLSTSLLVGVVIVITPAMRVISYVCKSSIGRWSVIALQRVRSPLP
jgi:hypothetical protein